ncbi:hypothetical protein M501DRAFT_927009 [Patellaria atrata CBS 101060]|uniref:F-box domain-containing protein n=1 Tax=Patellaria atrata CBS 101060 TaxID=1346257 RepID=A0A9P4VSZ5_9PEZI|nr:hypothetical protein M501DRAFT_927009 [Patellaria atrata CBS 101060]
MAFNILPIELNKEIAGYLESDKDLCNFRLVCQNACNAIDGDHLSFWRHRFLQFFDPTGRETTNAEYMRLYQTRRMWLKRGSKFYYGHKKEEKQCLQVVKDLINESFNGKDELILPDGTLTCLNLECLHRFVYNTDIIQNILRPIKQNNSVHPIHNIHPGLAAVQVALSHFTLDLALNPTVFSFDDSQKMAYECAKRAPIFTDVNKTHINMSWVLHMMNFFRWHIMRETEATLYYPYHDSLHELEKAKGWTMNPAKRVNAQQLGKYWKGTYAYLDRDEVENLRNHPANPYVYPDHNVDQGERSIQTLRLEIPPKEKVTWPYTFEKHLHALPERSLPRTRAQHRSGGASAGPAVSFQFNGDGYDSEPFYSSGWLNPLPNQYGIAGWQRMTMMKFFYDENGQPDENALWAYEGVVLPGGQIMLGRWWSPEEGAINTTEMYSGPFILWNVDGSPEVEDELDPVEPEDGIVGP